MLNYAVTMAGKGKRFSDAGYSIPKFMIEMNGISLFEYSLSSLPVEASDRLIFIVLKEHEKFGTEGFIKKRLSRLPGFVKSKTAVEIISLAEPTAGQAQTALMVKGLVGPEEELAVYNIDTYFRSSSLSGALSSKEKKLDGLIGGFKIQGLDPKWSFAKAGSDGLVTETAEKVQISDNALTGFYHFTRAGYFFETAEKALAEKDASQGEFYVAPLYNRLIAKGLRFRLDIAEKIIPMGTPEDLEKIKNSRITV